MQNSRAIRFFVVLALLMCSLTARSQNMWDAALDRYEQFCEQCIDLRQRSLAGEPVEVAEINGLLSQLSTLRATLQDAAGQMTDSQRSRFDKIRQRYAEAFGLEIKTDRATDQPIEIADPAKPVQDMQQDPSPILSEEIEEAVPEHEEIVVSVPSRPAFHASVIAYCAAPTVRPGLMVRFDIGRSGFYIKGSLWPVPQTLYFCKSDGTTDKGFIWTTGKEKTGAWSISGGATLRIANPLRIYAGGGYGTKTVLWEDAAGEWAGVSDLSSAGFCADAGLLLDLGHFTLMAGATTLSFRTIGFEVGAGIIF
jgi:hypothetical protein